jgi:hypothetical protein
LRLQISGGENDLNLSRVPGCDDLEPIRISIKIRLTEFMLLWRIEEKPAGVVPTAHERNFQ